MPHFSLSTHTVSQTTKRNDSLLRSGNVLPLSGDTSPNYAIDCNGTLYGRELKSLSCSNAVNQIPMVRHDVKFQTRGLGAYDVPLPQRYISRQ